MVVMGTKRRLLLKQKNYEQQLSVVVFSEAAGGHIPGQLPETTEHRRARRENSRTGKHNCVHLATLSMRNNNHDFAELAA